MTVFASQPVESSRVASSKSCFVVCLLAVHSGHVLRFFCLCCVFGLFVPALHDWDSTLRGVCGDQLSIIISSCCYASDEHSSGRLLALRVCMCESWSAGYASTNAMT